MAEHKYVVFKLDQERYGLPIESVERILPTQSVTRLPRTPKMFLGIFELRGSTIPALDARLRFDFAEADGAKNFVVVLTEGGRCALRVDEVDGIITLEDNQVEPNSPLFEQKNDEFLHAIGKKDDRLVVLLDPDHLVPKNLKGKISAAAA